MSKCEKKLYLLPGLPYLPALPVSPPVRSYKRLVESFTDCTKKLPRLGSLGGRVVSGTRDHINRYQLNSFLHSARAFSIRDTYSHLGATPVIGNPPYTSQALLEFPCIKEAYHTITRRPLLEHGLKAMQVNSYLVE